MAPRYCSSVSVLAARARKPSVARADRAPRARRGQGRLRSARPSWIVEHTEERRSAPGEGRELRTLPEQHAPDALGPDGQLRCLLEGCRLKLIDEEPVGPWSLQLPRYKVKNAITVSPGCQSSVQPREDSSRRDRQPGVHEDDVRPQLPAQRVDLVPSPQAQSRPPEKEEGDVRPQATSEAMQPVRAEAQPPHAVEAQEHRRRVAAPPSEAPRHRDALPDRDLHPLREAGEAAHLDGGAGSEVLRARRDERVRAAHDDALPPRAQRDVVVEVDGLEQRPQLVIAVLPPSQDLETQVDLGVAAESERAQRHQPPPSSRRASAAFTGR